MTSHNLYAKIGWDYRKRFVERPGRSGSRWDCHRRFRQPTAWKTSRGFAHESAQNGTICRFTGQSRVKQREYARKSLELGLPLELLRR
jgi:hypothetical protein